jgi:hypothetical protein
MTKLNFPAYLVEGNVIFLNAYTRLLDHEVIEWFNLKAKEFVDKYPEFLERGFAAVPSNDEARSLLKEVQDIWDSIIKRKIPYVVIDDIYLQFTGEKEETETPNVEHK